MEWWKNFIKTKVMDWVENHHGRISSSRVGKDLAALNPGRTDSLLQIRYISQKLYILSIILIAGVLLVILVFLKGQKNLWITEDGNIQRNESGLASRSYVLNAEIEDVHLSKIPLEIEAKELTSSEVKKRMSQLGQEIPEIIKADNDTIHEVRTDLNLINKDPYSNIEISWESSNRELMAEDGELIGNVSVMGEKVNLKATMFYKNFEEEKTYEITVFPKIQSTEGILLENIQKLLKEEEENSRESSYFELPQQIDGKTINWTEEKSPAAFIMFSLLILTVISVYYGLDQDLHKKYLKRNQEMMLDYGKFISQLELLISSGLSMRASLIRLGKDYRNRKEHSGKTEYLYEELLMSIKMLENGSSEQDALESFAKRSGLMSYKRLVSILCQNIRRGNEGLRIKLKEEIRNAFEERKMIARRMGEEAETKLLLPMMMMLGIVFMMILLPAFLSFGGI